MEKSLKFFLSLSLFWGACSNHTPPQDDELSMVYLDSAQHNYQGSVKNMTYLMKSVAHDSTNAEAYRELSIPYLKRGYPHLWFPLIAKTIREDPSWCGYRGCNYLFFYRDYERALADFRATDTLTPGFTDFPQAMSVKYLKGLCFLGLEQYDSALFHFQSYIDEDSLKYGLEWVDQRVFLYRAVVQNRLKNYTTALRETRKGLSIFNQSADLNYHKAIAHMHLNQIDSARLCTDLAMKYFDMGYFHSQAYTEVQEQIYRSDIEELRLALNRPL